MSNDVSRFTLYRHGLCLFDDHSLFWIIVKTSFPTLFETTTRCRRNISLSVALWPLIEDGAGSGLRPRSRFKPAKSVTRMPRGGQGVDITGKDSCLKAIYDRLDKGDTRCDDTEVRLNWGDQDRDEVVIGMVHRLRSSIEIDQTNDDDGDQSAQWSAWPWMNLSISGIPHKALEAKKTITGIFRFQTKWRSCNKYTGTKAVAMSIKASMTPKASQNAGCPMNQLL